MREPWKNPIEKITETEFSKFGKLEECFTKGPVEITSSNLKGCLIIDGMITSRLKFGEKIHISNEAPKLCTVKDKWRIK